MKNFRLHRVVAIVVLILAAAWVLTGKFAAVGSEIGHKDEAAQAGAPEAEGGAEAAPAAGDLLRTVAVTDAVFADYARVIRLSGTTEPEKRALLAARADGVVNSLTIAKGQSVEQGAMVMTLEGPETVARAKVAEVQFNQATRELERAEALFAKGSLAESQVTNTRAARDAAEAGFAQAKAEVDKLTLTAPFSGLVDNVELELGEWVRTGTPVSTILSLDPILVRVEVSEVDVGQVTTGAKARVRLVNGAELEGEVRFVAREATAQTRTFPVEIALPNPDATLPAGMTAEVQLFAKPVRTVKVPRSIITLSEAGELGLRVVDANNVAAFATVQIIDDTEDGMIVTGVPEGVKIVVSGQDLVRDGDKVIVSETAQAQP